MAKRRLLWSLYGATLLLFAATLLALDLYTYRVVNELQRAQLDRQLETQAQLIAHDLQSGIWLDTPESWARWSSSIAERVPSRVTVILPDGRVLADTAEDPARMENHSNRPEVIEALAGRVGHTFRYSETTRQTMKYLAIPLWRDNDVVAVVRTALPQTTIEQTNRLVRNRLLLGGILVAVLGAALLVIFLRRISHPLDRLRLAAERIADGDLQTRLPSLGAGEIGTLAATMNRMATQLEERLQTVERQRNELSAVLGSMVEGVLAVDDNERLLRLNQTAADWLGLEAPTALGRTIQETVRLPALQRILHETLVTGAPVEGDLDVADAAGAMRSYQVHGAPLTDSHGEQLGAMAVLHDITRLRRLETVRRDFVANVSHELRTPVTNIKGFVETLLDGALEDPNETKRFLEIIARHAQRLEALIDDLLSLARLEEETDRQAIELNPGELEEPVTRAVRMCEPLAASRDVSLRLDVQAGLRAAINAPLLEQALVNLIDNAVKYSPPGRAVDIVARGQNQVVTIEVRDRGVGIEARHQTRIFERFYRVDKARSRKVGGTGLGLSIVKHIALAHHGRIEVQSRPSEGSVFCLTLPAIQS